MFLRLLRIRPSGLFGNGSEGGMKVGGMRGKRTVRNDGLSRVLMLVCSKIVHLRTCVLR